LIRITLAIVVLFTLAFGNRCSGAGKAQHVIVVVWDGMRPDFISPQHTPALYGLAQRGTYFENHHAVYVTTTVVNGTALNTGAHPERSGIFSNRSYRPDIDPIKTVGAEGLETVRRGDATTHGHYLLAPTLAEIIQGAGFPTAVCGTKSVALLFDRSEERTSEAAKQSVNFFKGRVLPSSAMAQLVKANNGETFPRTITYPNIAQDRWTTKALLDGVWRGGIPKFSMLWLSDPDFTQHDRGPGSKEAIAALECSDRNLASVEKRLEELNLLSQTDIFVVSDHGFSGVAKRADVVGALRKAGFNAVTDFKSSQPGETLVVGLGGSVVLYVSDHNDTTTRKLAEFFQASDFAGVIFCRIPVKGTFPLSQVHISATNGPDLLVSMRWSAGTNEFGTPGLMIEGSEEEVKGSHGALSPFELHNTLVAAGPDFQSAFKDELPTGNIDLAPTILSILGITPPQPMDGRVLTEALINVSDSAPKVERRTIEASRLDSLIHWRQYLKFTTVGKAIYFDEGNGATIPK
jgi:arylsulfatase A-like enzyme